MTNFDLTPLWGFWSVYIAFQYAKLWQEGYDWRDVFKQPRDRLFFDVVAEWTDNVRALWDPKKRAEVRERARVRSGAASLFEGSDAADRPQGVIASPRALSTLAGAYASVVRDAARQRDDILRLHAGLSKRDREAVADVPATANALYQRVEALAMNLTELERNVAPNAAEAVESEIASLEAQANPLDIQASEERVKRLAYLKRQRQQIADFVRRRERAKEKLSVVVPLTLMLVFVLLYLNTRSLVETGIVLLAVPFSLIGAIWLLYFLDYNMSVAVWVGLIALAGLDAETGVVMLLYLTLAHKKWQDEGRLRTQLDLREAIVDGAARRIRPKLMTVLTMMIGLIPVLWSDGTGADVMKRIAAPMVGGLVTSFVLELLVYPAIFAVWKGRGLPPGDGAVAILKPKEETT